MPVKTRELIAKRLYGVSLVTLDSIPVRALKLLRAVGTNKTIRALMLRRGLTDAVAKDGWRRLENTSGRTTADAIDSFDPIVIAAIAFVDPYDEIIVELVQASLAKRMAEQAAFLLEGLRPATGMSGVLNVKTLVTRLRELKNSPARKATRKQDQAALDLLAERGITPELVDQLESQMNVIMASPEVEPVDEAGMEAADEAYVRSLGELREWYDEWSRVARIAVTRRDHLMLLGLAHAKSRETEPEKPEVPSDNDE